MILTLRSPVNHTMVLGHFINSNDARKGKNQSHSKHRNISYITSTLIEKGLMASRQDVNYHPLIYNINMRLYIFLHQTTIHTQCVVQRLHFLPSPEFIHRMNFTKNCANRSYHVSLPRHFVTNLKTSKSFEFSHRLLSRLKAHA